MKLGALFSGGKDSTYSIYSARQNGHEVVCLITMKPTSDESMLFHFPDIWITKYLAQAMEIPLLIRDSTGQTVHDESVELDSSIKEAMQAYKIEGLYTVVYLVGFKSRHLRICARNTVLL